MFRHSRHGLSLWNSVRKRVCLRWTRFRLVINQSLQLVSRLHGGEVVAVLWIEQLWSEQASAWLSGGGAARAYPPERRPARAAGNSLLWTHMHRPGVCAAHTGSTLFDWKHKHAASQESSVFMVSLHVCTRSQQEVGQLRSREAALPLLWDEREHHVRLQTWTWSGLPLAGRPSNTYRVISIPTRTACHPPEL